MIVEPVVPEESVTAPILPTPRPSRTPRVRKRGTGCGPDLTGITPKGLYRVCAGGQAGGMNIERTVETPTPIEAVFAYLSDFTTTTEWDPGTVETTRRTGDGGLG